ncbi:hypothetical protein ABIF64_003974 [Bradyrhizobium japonicum]
MPWLLPFTTLPNQPPAFTSASASAMIMVEEMPRSGATPACEARPKISTFQRSAPTAPMMTLEAEPPS